MKFQGVDYFNVDDLLSDNEKMTRNMVRDFLEKEVAPLIVDAFHRETPLDMPELAPRMGALGMLGAFIPEEYGGAGASYTTFGLICQEAERIDSAVRGFIGVQSGLVMFPIWQFGTEAQKRKWLPLLASGRKIGCFGLTEPNCGSDVASLETTARPDGDHWVINGVKQWISDASIADLALVWAKTDDGIRGFLVERGTGGFSQTFQARKGSMRAGDVGELALADCRVSAENTLPAADSFRHVFSCLDRARFGIAWGALGMAMDCYQTALNYARERVQFGAPIAAHQLVQAKLVDMLVEITRGQLLAHRLGRLMDEGSATYTQISLAKKSNMDVARLCASTAREILGANGVSLDYSPIRHMANIESVYTYQGTDDMHTLILGSDITGFPAFRKNESAGGS